MKQVLQKGLHTPRALDGVVHLVDFGVGQFFPAGTYRGIGWQAAEKDFDFGQGEIQIGGKADHEHAILRVRRIATLASHTVWRFENAQLFVVTNGRWFETGAGGKFSDFHLLPSSVSFATRHLDLKSTLTFKISSCKLQTLLKGS